MRRTLLPMLLLLAACSATPLPSASESAPPMPSASESPPPSDPESSTSEAPEPSRSRLPELGMPGRSLVEPAGEYGWSNTTVPSGMHHVVGDAETQIVFVVDDDCFSQAAGVEPAPSTVAGLEGQYLEPYANVLFVNHGPMTTGAYALPIGDRTLCVYLSWDAEAAPDLLDEARAVVDSIRGQLVGEDGVRINFTLPLGWDTG